jgi:diphosphate-dependent phosphofructokinase
LKPKRYVDGDSAIPPGLGTPALGTVLFFTEVFMPNKIDQYASLLKHPKVKKIVSNDSDEVVERRNYRPPVCEAFTRSYTLLKDCDRYRFSMHPEAVKKLGHIIDNKVQTVVGTDAPEDTLKTRYTRLRNIGIVFSGGPAPGGHNVIAGIYDAAKQANPETRVFGFLLGPDGIIENEAIEITGSLVDEYRNLGGFTMIKTGRTKIDSPEKVALSRETCKMLRLDALVIVGGDDSNTNAAFLAQEMFEDGVKIIGVPKTIDGDIQVRDSDGKVLCAMSFGFHTAARAFAKAIGNLCTDSGSDIKY